MIDYTNGRQTMRNSTEYLHTVHKCDRTSLVAQLVQNLPAVQETLVQFLGQEYPWRRDSLPTPIFLGFPRGSDGEESAYTTGDLGWIPELARSPGEGSQSMGSQN